MTEVTLDTANRTKNQQATASVKSTYSKAGYAQKSQAKSTLAKSRRRIDPRVSFLVLLLMNIQMGLSSSLVLEAGAALLSIACMAYCGKYRALRNWITFYVLFAALGFGLILIDNTFISPFAASFLIYRHLIPIFMFGTNMIATTRAGELACALQQMHLSSKMTVALCVAFRFFPTMWREFKAVSEAMKTRGMRVNLFSIVRHPVQTIEHFLVPVIGRLGTIADELGNSVVVRGVETNRKRSSYYQLKLNAFDLAIGTGAILLFVAALVQKIGAF